MAEPEKTLQEEKKELIERAKQLPMTDVFSLRPRNFDEAFRFANLIAESDLLPKEFYKKPANVLVAVQLGMELGVAPMQALQSMYVINGRPSIYGDLLPAIMFHSGMCELFDESGDETKASCTVKRKGFAAITRTFSMAEAVAAGLPNRNPTYKSYPKRMLQMRARAFAIRDAFPDVLKGVAVYEEEKDRESVDITPSKPMQIPQPTQEASADDKPRDTDPRAGADHSPEPERASAGVRTDSDPKAGDPGLRKGAEKSQKPTLQAVIEWCKKADLETILDNTNWAHEQLKGRQQSEQLSICTAIQDRKNALTQEQEKKLAAEFPK